MTYAGKIPASDISYLDLVIIFSVIVYVINTYLDFRQVRHIAFCFLFLGDLSLLAAVINIRS